MGALPAVPPNAELDIAVDMRSPGKAGRFVSYWRLQTPDGIRFGHRMWVDIVVRDPAFVEATKIVRAASQVSVPLVQTVKDTPAPAPAPAPTAEPVPTPAPAPAPVDDSPASKVTVEDISEEEENGNDMAEIEEAFVKIDMEEQSGDDTPAKKEEETYPHATALAQLQAMGFAEEASKDVLNRVDGD